MSLPSWQYATHQGWPVAALTEERHSRKTYEVTGPQLLSFDEAAAELSAAIGRPIRYIPITLDQFHTSMTETGREFIADIFTEICRETLDGQNEPLTGGVQQALSCNVKRRTCSRLISPTKSTNGKDGVCPKLLKFLMPLGQDPASGGQPTFHGAGSCSPYFTPTALRKLRNMPIGSYFSVRFP